LFRAHPCQSTQNAFSYQFLPHTRQEPLYPSEHMHCEAQRIYTLIYNIVVVGQSRTGLVVCDIVIGIVILRAKLSGSGCS
jgi:hypothetical protein